MFVVDQAGVHIGTVRLAWRITVKAQEAMNSVWLAGSE